MMPSVAASEAGRAQICRDRREANRCYFGRDMDSARALQVPWKGTPWRVIAPYERAFALPRVASDE